MNDDDRELDEILAGDQGDGFDMMGAPWPELGGSCS